MTKLIYYMLGLSLFMFSANAEIVVKNNISDNIVDEEGNEIDEQTAIATLENDIKILDEQIAQCKKQKKLWIGATAAGSAGVLSTGITAAVQGIKIKEKRDSLEEQKQYLKDLKNEL